MTPTVGRIVHFFPDTGVDIKPEPIAAIITRVNREASTPGYWFVNANFFAGAKFGYLEDILLVKPGADGRQFGEWLEWPPIS